MTLLVQNDDEGKTPVRPGPVTQPWTWKLTFMQQSVLLTAIRGPDGIHKNHISKRLIRWLRRCTLYSAFDRTILALPYDDGEPQGGSFTGPSLLLHPTRGRTWFFFENQRSPEFFSTWQEGMHGILEEYMQQTDEMPHHFQLHFLHAAEIVGYKHSRDEIREWWSTAYCRLVNDMHLRPELEETMDRRLSDCPVAIHTMRASP